MLRFSSSPLRFLAGLGAALSGASCSAPLPQAPLASSTHRAIYGEDDRLEMHQEPSPLWQERARATAALVLSENLEARGMLTCQEPPRYLLRPRLAEAERPFCPGERFVDQPQLAGCTGVLIGPDLLLTAGHCLRLPLGGSEACARIRILFDWRQDPESGQAPEFLRPDQVYACAEVISGERDFAARRDWALLRLDRVAQDRTPVPLAPAETALQTGRSVTQIGHPMGWPLKISHQGRITSTEHPDSFLAATDTYSGSSGGPLFDSENGELLGILATGVPDFEIDWEQEPPCQRSRVCSEENPCRGERYSRVPERVRQLLAPPAHP